MHASFEVVCGILRSSCGGGDWKGRYPGLIFFVIQHIGFGALSQSPPRQSWWRRGRRGRGWLVWLAGWLLVFSTADSSPSPLRQHCRQEGRRCSTATLTVAVRRRIQPLLPPPVSTPPLVQVLRPWLRTRTEQNCSASAPPCLGCCVSLWVPPRPPPSLPNKSL